MNKSNTMPSRRHHSKSLRFHGILPSPKRSLTERRQHYVRSQSEYITSNTFFRFAKGGEMEETGSSTCDSEEGLVVVRVNVPELSVQKCLQFHRDELVWDVKQQCLASIPKVAMWFRELKESFNYGLFQPPQNGKAGKFLDEERPLGDYPFQAPVGILELKYKRRVYKMLSVDEKAIRGLHTRANLRRFLDLVNANNVEKITKLCAKGLDPNFHCQETGETPLTQAVLQKKPGKLIMALVNGGCLLDYRTKDGSTAMHRAVEKNNWEAVRTLLDLGASPSYRDGRGLTPLYLSVTHSSDPMVCEALLHDRAFIGAQDLQGWHEVHQACRNSLVQHLEHLLYYGADMNARNASGNTPLHVCAVNNADSCARLLLFRGAQNDALNFANQTPHQVAVIAQNFDLAEVIKNHSSDDVVPYREAPKYNPKRRTSNVPPLPRTHSDPRLEMPPLPPKPPSPSPSNRSLPPFSSASSLSETSTGSSSTCTQHSADSEVGSVSVVTGDGSDRISDSSGVCTSGGSGMSFEHTPTEQCVILPGTSVVCITDYLPGSAERDHLTLKQGDLIEVTGSTDSGMLEGSLKGMMGVFPNRCVQEVRLRNKQNPPHQSPSRVLGRRDKNQVLQGGTVPRNRKTGPLEPRTVVLHKGRKGFGFVLRGAKATSPLMELAPSQQCPALQYLDDVDPEGVADRAGLSKGDFLLAINGEDVTSASHERVVNLIRQSGDLVAMTVVSAPPGWMHGPSSTPPPLSLPPSSPPTSAIRQCATLPRRLPGRAPAPPKRDPRTTLSVGRARAKSLVAGLTDYENWAKALADCSVEPTYVSAQAKTATIRSRPGSRRLPATDLEELFHNRGITPKADVPQTPRVYTSVAELKRWKAHKKSRAELLKMHKDFHSSPDLKAAPNSAINGSLESQPIDKRKSLSQEDLNRGKNARFSWSCMPDGTLQYQGSWRSIEELYADEGSEAVTPVVENGGLVYADARPLSQRIESMNLAGIPTLLRRSKSANVTRHPPPPTYPPPPPPIGQVVKVDISKAMGEYALVNSPNSGSLTDISDGVVSSFRPDISAKLYASPEELKSVGYKPLETATLGRKPRSRSQSLPPRPKRTNGEKNRNEPENNEPENPSEGVYCTTTSTFKTKDEQVEDVTYAQPVRKDGRKTPFIPDPDYSDSECELRLRNAENDPKKARMAKKIKGEKKSSVVFVSCVDVDNNVTVERRDSQGKMEQITKNDNSGHFKDLLTQKVAERQARLTSGESKSTSFQGEDNGSSLQPQEVVMKQIRHQQSLFEKVKIEVKNASLFGKKVEKYRKTEKVQDKKPTKTCRSFSVEEIQKVKTHLKGSKSYPNEFVGDECENSSSGVSSDQDMQGEGGIRDDMSDKDNSIIPVDMLKLRKQRGFDSDDNSETSESSDDMSDRTWIIKTENKSNGDKSKQGVNRRTGMLTKNAVSLVQLPPPIETGETDADSDAGDAKEQDTISTVSSLSTLSTMSSNSSEKDKSTGSVVRVEPPKQQHELPKSETVCKSEKVSKSELVSKSEPVSKSKSVSVSKTVSKSETVSKPVSASEALSKSRPTHVRTKASNEAPVKQKPKSGDVERSIEESLQLIQMHCDSLSQVNVLAGLVPPPPEFKGGSAAMEVGAIAPPPGFGDTESESEGSVIESTPLSSKIQKTTIKIGYRGSNQERKRPYMNASGGLSGVQFLGTQPRQVSTTLRPGEVPNPRCGPVLVTCTSTRPPAATSSDTTTHLKTNKSSFRNKPLYDWTTKDTTDWLESLFMPEYKDKFYQRRIDGPKLMTMDNDTLMNLGVKRVGHRLNIEKSLKRYMLPRHQV